MIDLSSARQALTAAFHITPCLLYPSTAETVAGSTTRTYGAPQPARCHIKTAGGSPSLAPQRAQELSEPMPVELVFPHGTALELEMLAYAAGRYYRITRINPQPEFSLTTSALALEVPRADALAMLEV